MRKLELAKAFKKDLKLSERRGKDVKKLQRLIDLILDGDSLPARHGDHALTGNLRGLRDCHVEPDWVLLYEVTDELLRLIRLGTHSDLFP